MISELLTIAMTSAGNMCDWLHKRSTTGRVRVGRPLTSLSQGDTTKKHIGDSQAGSDVQIPHG